VKRNIHQRRDRNGLVGGSRRTALTLFGSLLLVSSAGLPITQAQAPASAPVAKSYINKGVLSLPIQIDPRLQAGLREVQLWVKDNPAHPWTFNQRAMPSQSEFRFRAPHDGEYWFTIASVDKNGRQEPADLKNEPPGVIVVVDTQAPQVELRALPASAEGQCVQCVLHDANPDETHTSFLFQTGDQMWRPLEPMPGKPDTYCIPANAVSTGMVRVEVADKAGNQASRELNLNAPGVAVAAMQGIPNREQGTAKQAAPLVSSSGPVLPPPESSGVIQASYVEPATPGADATRLAVPDLPHQVRKAAVPRPMPAVSVAGNVESTEHPSCHETQTGTAAVPCNRQLVNKRRVFLDYQIDQTGPSGVGRVEIYLTRDRGQSWEPYGEDKDHTSPAEVILPGEGLFGVTLVVTNGRGFGGTPPAAGDTPDWWIEVDMTKPDARIVSIGPSKSGEPGGMLITWNARDKNLKPDPIDLYWSDSPHGQRHVIAKGLKNDRQYHWAVPPEVGAHAFICLSVTDQAGNVTECVTPEPVAIDDLSRPHIHVVGISTSGPARNLEPSSEQ
jgi:hypothetical protein